MKHSFVCKTSNCKGCFCDCVPSSVWSVTNVSFTLMSMRKNQWCQTPKQLARAIDGGRRSWDLQPLPPRCNARARRASAHAHDCSLWKILHESVFHPKGCSIRQYTPESACDTFNKFTKVIIMGDSLSRHLMIALSIVFAQDLQYAGIPHTTPYRRVECSCDGLFSESGGCRKFVTRNVLTHS